MPNLGRKKPGQAEISYDPGFWRDQNFRAFICSFKSLINYIMVNETSSLYANFHVLTFRLNDV